MSALGGAERGRIGREVIDLLAGVVDFGLERAESVMRHARGLLGRSDLAEMATDCRADLKARGEVVVARFAPPAESHMETLAKLAAASRGDHGAG